MTESEMTLVGVERKPTPVVFAKDGEVFASSRDVAAFFGKNHRDVMRAIDNLVQQAPDLGGAQFCAGVYLLPETGNQQHRFFEMTRDGFTLLAMGFTGAKALQWKLRYIEAFNKMEAEIRKGATAAIDVRDPSQLATIAIQLIEVNKELEGTVAELSPKARAYERLEGSEGSMGVRLAAKVLKVPERQLVRWLQAHGWAYRQNGIGVLQAYVDKRNRGYLEHRSHVFYDEARGEDRSVAQMLITPKGMARLSEIFEEKGFAA